MLRILPNAEAVIPGVTGPIKEPTKAQLRGVICNPLITGMGPFVGRIDDRTWIHLARKEIRENGAEQFFVNMLYVMRETFAHYTPKPEETPSQEKPLDAETVTA